MKACVSCDELVILGQVSAPPIKDRIEVIDCWEVAIDDRLVDQPPEVLGRL
jgi:hypothetical protein